MKRAPLALAVAALMLAAAPLPANAETAAERFEREKEAVRLHDEAQHAYNRGEYRAAIELLEEALDRDPKGTELYYNIGIIYERLGELDQAIEAFEHYRDQQTNPTLRKDADRILRRLRGARAEVESATQPPAGATVASEEADNRYLVPTVAALTALTVGGLFAVGAAVRDPGDRPQTGPDATVQDIRDDADVAHTYAVVADISFAVGVTSAAFAVYLFATRDDVDPATAVVYPTGSGFGVRF